jgi:L-ribulokinase
MGSKSILEHLKKEGIVINGITAVGGISFKSEFIMQMCADAFNMPIKIARTEQSCALGAAMIAATAAGVFTSVEAAQHAMGSGYCKVYTPDAGKNKQYEALFLQYQTLGNAVEGIQK